MKGNFDKLMAPLLHIEGGLSDRPLSEDPGGRTNLGVTQGLYDAWRQRNGKPKQDVARITRGEAKQLFLDEMWIPIRGDLLPSGVDWATFDFAVNSGPATAVKELQRTVGVVADGQVGQGTLSGIAKMAPTQVINSYCDRRLRFMKRLKNWGPNKNGWTARVAQVRSSALKMAQDGQPPEKVQFTSLPVNADAKAPENVVAVTKTADGQGISLTTIGVAGQKARDWASANLEPHAGLDSVFGRAAYFLFSVVTVVGVALLAYSWLKKLRDQGGLAVILGGLKR